MPVFVFLLLDLKRSDGELCIILHRIKVESEYFYSFWFESIWYSSLKIHYLFIGLCIILLKISFDNFLYMYFWKSQFEFSDHFDIEAYN